MKRIYQLDESVFDDAVNTPEAAYYVGLLMADGNVMSPKPTLQFNLAERDREQVYKYRQFLKSSHPVITQKNSGYKKDSVMYTHRVHSRRLVTALAAYGITPRKSRNPDCRVLQLEHNRDFWRGMVCGDGSLHISWQKKRPLPVIQLAGSHPNMELFLAYCKLLVSTNTNIRPNKSIWTVTLAGNPAYVVISTLFAAGDVALRRKALLAKQMLKECEHFSKQTRRLDFDCVCLCCGAEFRKRCQRAPGKYCSYFCRFEYERQAKSRNR